MPESAEGHYCHECGAYKAKRPRVEMRRDLSMRAWEINIWTDDGETEHGMQVVVPDNRRSPWSFTRPQDLSQGMPPAGLRREDD